MQVPIFIQQLAQGNYRAKAWDISADGVTEEDALAHLATLLQQGQITTLEIQTEKSKDWRQVAGLFEHDTTFDELQAYIAQKRQEENEKEGIFPEQNA
jgi:hypothetical protein